jgi:hypothetical protein
MRIALTQEESPLDADLEKVLPGVHERLQANNVLVKELHRHVDHKLDQMHGTMLEGFDHLHQQTALYVNETDRMVGASLVNAGTRLLNNSHESPVDGTSPSFSPDGSTGASRVLFSTGATGASRVLFTQEEPTVGETNGQQQLTTEPEEYMFSMYRLQSKHTELTSVWEQWFGEGSFDDGIGGVNGRNVLRGAKWRKHLDNTEYSRHNRFVKGVLATSNQRNCPPEEIIAEWQPYFIAAGKSVGKLVLALQSQGLLAVGAKRGKSAAARSQ